jgi:hypothetical protein
MAWAEQASELSSHKTEAVTGRAARRIPQRTHGASALSAQVLELQRHAGNRAALAAVRAGNVGAYRQGLVRQLPEDVGPNPVHMMDRTFRLARDVRVGGATMRAGTFVVVRVWDNSSPTVTVMLSGGGAGETYDVPKKLIRPVDPACVAGVAPYDAGLDAVAGDFERGEQMIAAERARESRPKPDEIARLEGLQAKRLKLLNHRLAQASDLNRFDASIKKWTDHYNKKFGYTETRGLDPDLVKAILYEESQMGTRDQYYPAAYLNLGQVGSDRLSLELIREDKPELITEYHLETIEQDLSAAQAELRALNKVKTPDTKQTERKARLEALSKSDWNVFLLHYRAAGQNVGLREAVVAHRILLFGSPHASDPDFGIRQCVRMLFAKREQVSTWEEAARAYNGIGPPARNYKARVTTRMAGAKAAQKANKPYIPRNPDL